MSYSTWHFITPSPSLGWLFRNMVLPRFVSLWQAMSRRHNDMCDLIAWILSQDGCFINTVHCAHVYNTQQTPTTNFTPHGADGIDGTCFDDALLSSCRLRLCYYVVVSPLLPAFVCPGRARASVSAAEPMTYLGRPRFCCPSAFSFCGPTQPRHTTRLLRTPVVIV